MKIRKFNVVELKNHNRATILQVLGSRYFAEIVNTYGITLDKRIIEENEINKVIYSKRKNKIDKIR